MAISCAAVALQGAAAAGDWMWHVTVPAEARPAKVSFWIPPKLKLVTGTFIFSKHGSFRGYSTDRGLRALATELNCAVLHSDQELGTPYRDTRAMLDVLAQFADLSAHPEVAHAPLFIFGHSNSTENMSSFGGGCPERIIAWVAMKSAFGAQFSVPALYGVPGMVVSGEKDHSYFQDQLATVKRHRKESHALMHMIVEPDGPHWPVKQTFRIMQAFIKTCYYLRVPYGADATLGPVKLRTLDESSGWLGANLEGKRVRMPDYNWKWETPVDVRQVLPIAPFNDFVGDRSTASWFPDESYARKWQEFCHNAAIRDWAKLPPGLVENWRRNRMPGGAAGVTSEILPSIVKRLATARSYASTIGELRRIRDRGEDAERTAEAGRILDSLTKRAETQLAQAERLERTNPALALRAYETVRVKFAGTGPATRAAERARDRTLRDEVKAWQYLGAARTAGENMRDVKGAKRSYNDVGFRAANIQGFRMMVAAARMLSKRYADTVAAERVKDLLASYEVPLGR